MTPHVWCHRNVYRQWNNNGQGSQPPHISERGKWLYCNVLLHLTTKNVFENFGRWQFLDWPPAGCRPDKGSRNQFVANGTTEIEIRKRESSYAPECRGGQTGRRPRASKAGGIQKVKLQKLKCCNKMIVPIVRLLSHALNFCIEFFETCWFVNTRSCVFKCQQFSHSSIAGTYTLGVRCTLTQPDSDVAFSRSCDQVKFIKKGLKDNYGCFIDFLSQISKLSYSTRLI